MSLKKTYVKSKNVCKVTFSLPEKEANEAYIVGDFNAWQEQATPMKKGKGGFSATLELEPGREYQFRYLLDGSKWANDDAADGYYPTPFHDAENSVIVA